MGIINKIFNSSKKTGYGGSKNPTWTKEDEDYYQSHVKSETRPAKHVTTKAEKSVEKYSGNPVERIIGGFSKMGGDISAGKGPAADFFGGSSGKTNRGPPSMDVPSFMDWGSKSTKSRTHKKKVKGLKPAFYDPKSGRTYVAKGKSHKKKKRDTGPNMDTPDFI